VSAAEKIELFDVAAQLAAAIERTPDGRLLFLSPAAIAKAQARLRAGVDMEGVAHLIALAAKVHRIAGAGGLAVVGAIASLVVDALGSPEAAADRFASAGLEAAAAMIGKSAEVRAPREEPKLTLVTAKPRRGLR
jgi:hypothetical protein